MPIDFNEMPQPATLHEAVAQLYNNLNDDEREYVKEHGAAGLHFSAGMALRNGWNLWGTQEDKAKDLHEYFKTAYGIGHADDMSGMILDSLAAMVKDPSNIIDAKVMAQGYIDYWRKQGIDPLTQEKL